TIGGTIAPLLIPLGFFGWQLAAAAVAGFVAKENVVATLAITIAASSEEILNIPGGVLSQFFTPVTAYAFLIFNLFTPPCFAAIGAMNTELADRKWLLKGLAFQFSVGYLLAMLITQIGTVLFYGELAAGFIPAGVIMVIYALIVYYLVRKSRSKKMQFSAVAH
ncbi:MAG: nucleoside recognition domain-containing protein, partial [Clostridia bacterium]|nr:nucleoside recognition domain-containing protein [Clostridia bacterium]